MQPINLVQKLGPFTDHWSPYTGDVATAAVKVAI